MDEDLIRQYGRWVAADRAGRDDEADGAFKNVFVSVPVQPSRPDLVPVILRAVADAAAGDARRARVTRAAFVAGAVAGSLLAAWFGAGLAASLAWTGIVGFVDLIVRAVVTTASAMDRGADVWTVLVALGRAVAAFVANPKVMFTLLAIQGIAAMALVALQRLLGTDRESFR